MKLIPLTEEEVSLLDFGGTVLNENGERIKIKTTAWDPEQGIVAVGFNGELYLPRELYQEDKDD